MDKKELFERVAEDRVRFISFQFSDVSGTVKSVDAPISRLEGAVNQGIWFDGSSVEGFARIQESDMRLKPDIDTYAVLPWSPENMRRARLFCNIYNPDGTPFAGDPRGNLSRQLAALEERGMRLMVGSEPEFFLFRRNGSSDIHPVPHDVGGYFDFSPNDEAVRVRTELMQALDSMGLEVEVGHHECALGQHEIDFHFSNALRSADNVLTLKYTVKAIAAQNGLIASFMPKPIFGINGSGMHCHQSLFDLRGNNLFYDAADEYHLSPLAYGFIAGQLAHARAFSAVTAPTVNSYKRLVPGYEAPVYVGWAQTNRSALIRIPRPLEGMTTSVRAELRCPDPSCNPYLAYSSMLAAALDGMKQQLTPPEPLNDVNVYELSREERQNLNIVELPGSLREALVELEKDSVIQQALGETLYNAFRRAKWAEWERYRLDVTDWELARYLETA
ncbi:MAG TPA: type I glutamate--ammonia ligase [Anaerolineaceae bacterium]|jgi:glutamine synthetase|nr:type I glutamate--ammonia ligase [Anaerolineaceae bacterium]